ncbi:MAG: DUF72 domain-containing protein [Burkholderiales bacterium]|nr:DUF72 domain-containing protein [Burkholderiales bacterium]
MARTWIGTSGWSYDDWRGAFYPDGLPHARELEFASRCFNSLELNATFYSLKRPDDYREWRDTAPRGFRYAVKGSRFITHNKRLKEVETPLANFLASGVLLLEEKLGPLVWQLPENARFDAGRMERFFALLPRDTHQAARLARRHDARVKGRSWTKTDRKRPMRHALEVRSESFFNPEFARLARRFDVAIVVSDSADWPCVEEITAGFVYLRLHGHEQTYASRYGARALRAWAERIRRWRAGREPGDARRITDREPPRRKTRDVYVYFDNDRRAYAPQDALYLAAHVGADPAPAGVRPVGIVGHRSSPAGRQRRGR